MTQQPNSPEPGSLWSGRDSTVWMAVPKDDTHTAMVQLVADYATLCVPEECMAYHGPLHRLLPSPIDGWEHLTEDIESMVKDLMLSEPTPVEKAVHVRVMDLPRSGLRRLPFAWIGRK